MQTAPDTDIRRRVELDNGFDLLIPEVNGTTLDQDEEWFWLGREGKYERIRCHDYDVIYDIPGLYEALFYDCLQCTSPSVVGDAAREAWLREGRSTDAEMRVLDLGGGNGLSAIGFAERFPSARFIGLDIIPAAREAADRDRPGLYEHYIVNDVTELTRQERDVIDRFEPNGFLCVAALGFGDIPVPAFTAIYETVSDGGLIAFNIRDTFLDPEADQTEFSTHIRGLQANGSLDIKSEKLYVHRYSLSGDPIHYYAVAGLKRSS